MILKNLIKYYNCLYDQENFFKGIKAKQTITRKITLLAFLIYVIIVIIIYVINLNQ